MQLLDIPNNFKDMTAQITMTGITILQKGKYKQRHGGMKELVQIPNRQLVTKSQYKKLIEDSIPQPKRKKIVPIKTTQPPKPRLKTPNYKVNKKEVTHRIRNFVNQMSGEKLLYFWTITFPQNTTDDTAFICFNKWLTRVRKELNLRSYLWITERQKNNTIHFHICLHQRLCVKKANRFMRACLFTCIDNKEIEYSRTDAKNYNGVDIAKNRKTRRVTNFAKEKSSKALTSYLTKYITKNEGTFSHLAWHSSRDYSNLVISVRVTSFDLMHGNTMEFFKEVPLFESEWFKFYQWKSHPPPEFLSYIGQLNNNIVNFINN